MNHNYFAQGAPTRRKVFVSYHHHGDQAYYDRFSTNFHDRYEAITDNSLERKIDSASVDYIVRRIREHHLQGSSCTLVLCGIETPNRKYVDWEIDASLNQSMGLVAVLLPTLQIHPNGGTNKPARLQDNIDSGYAEWVWWSEIIANPGLLLTKIESANSKSKTLIRNQRARMQYNG